VAVRHRDPSDRAASPGRGPVLPGHRPHRIDPAAEPIADQVTDRVAAQAVSRELAAAVAGLSRGQRDALLLVASGLSYTEAGRALGVPAGTVSSRLVRARRRVREALGAQDPAHPGKDAAE
jgi:RNA polymerase sigma factor (sigma-70 family)